MGVARADAAPASVMPSWARRRPRRCLESSVEVLDHRRATLDPIAAIDVAKAGHPTDGGVMNVTTDHAMRLPATRLGRKRMLELADEADRVLYFQLGPLRDRPIGEPERSARHVEMSVEPDRDIVGLVAQQRQPARVADHHVEQITVNHEVA